MHVKLEQASKTTMWTPTRRRWFVEGDHHDVEHFEMDFGTGDHENARFRFKEGTSVQGLVCTNNTIYQDIVPNRRVVLVSTMVIGERRISASLVAAEFLGDPTRRSLVEKLSQGPVSVLRLAEPLAITLAAVVQHLQVLEESGLVRTEKTGRVRTCSLEPAGLSVLEQ